MKEVIAIIFLLLTLGSCTENKGKINYDLQVDTVATFNNIIQDTTKILVSELPVRFDSTNILIYAVGLVDLQERGGYSKFGSGTYSSSSISSSYFSEDKLIGNYINLIFEKPNGIRKTLTDNKMRIISANFLRGVYNRTKQGYILYTIYDRDTNSDGELNRNDLEALYISNIDGTQLTKLSKELHEFYDYRTLKGSNVLYFRTLEDINKDGKLNNKDLFHYYKIQLTTTEFKIEEYNPLDAFEK
jgi:hypothetical protein